MTKSTFCLILIVFVGVLFSCTKDILPNPAAANIPNQTLIYKQDFNSAFPNWPTGWTASAGGWQMDTSSANNSITGPGEGTYAGASGGAMTEISNPTSGSGGTYTMTTSSISTTGYSNITCIWGTRNSKHFSDNGSKITRFAWSADGVNWNTINYTESPNNSDWSLVDGGVNIALTGVPAGASIMFQWTANVVVTASGDYRLDDFQVFGTPN